MVMVSSAGGSFTVVTDPEQPVSKMHELAYSSSKAALNMVTLRYAQALPDIKFNVATPGEVANHKFAATDMNNHMGAADRHRGHRLDHQARHDRRRRTDRDLHRPPRPRRMVNPVLGNRDAPTPPIEPEQALGQA